MLNFNSANEGQWFFFDPDNEELGGICLRELAPEEFDRIEKITVKHKKKVIRGAMFDDVKEDTKTKSKMRWDYCIVDWEGISLDGTEMECTSENKQKMMKVTDFVKFVADSLSDAVEVNKALEEARVKNSLNSSKDNSASPTVELA